jgi:hypothetical protein
MGEMNRHLDRSCPALVLLSQQETTARNHSSKAAQDNEAVHQSPTEKGQRVSQESAHHHQTEEQPKSDDVVRNTCLGKESENGEGERYDSVQDSSKVKGKATSISEAHQSGDSLNNKDDDSVNSTHEREDQSTRRDTLVVTQDCESPPQPTAAATVTPDAFARMMERSKTVFSQREEEPMFCFHMNENGDLSVTPGSGDEEGVSWSATVTVKERSSGRSNDPPSQIRVVLSSRLPSHHEGSPRPQMVRRPSRLSVPVLKSVLQKAVRRRRPLPAVRTAMELADRSLGDLLRRLPIIALEDSTLHPDFDFTVWLMVAHSKGYVPPPRLTARLFEIIYEIASCQWSDPLEQSYSDDDEPTDNVPTFSSLAAPDALPMTRSQRWLFSMLLRAAYGGMRGDVRMVRRYAAAWLSRCGEGPVPDALASRLQSSVTANDDTVPAEPSLQWMDVPGLIHRRPRQQSANRVAPLCSVGIQHLAMEDICVEGVDFHCSAVLDELFSDERLCGVCYDLYLLSQVDKDGEEQQPLDRRAWLESTFQRCMWRYSSGVNRRRNLQTGEPLARDERSWEFELWNKLLAPRAHAYQKKFVEQRLIT